jgi:hypothetical protein
MLKWLVLDRLKFEIKWKYFSLGTNLIRPQQFFKQKQQLR